jgi:glyoxylase-like metal-dependent hydrolase (beta-lactamase superfamily II)
MQDGDERVVFTGDTLFIGGESCHVDLEAVAVCRVLTRV